MWRGAAGGRRGVSWQEPCEACFAAGGFPGDSWTREQMLFYLDPADELPSRDSSDSDSQAGSFKGETT